MSLKNRLAKIETRWAPAKGNHVRLLAKLAHIEAMVVASGDTSDRPDASLIERAVRRYLRGDATPADALRDLVAGRWPEQGWNGDWDNRLARLVKKQQKRGGGEEQS